METINNLVLQEYKLELANKTNQLKALQARVHPHFLYNALQSIGTLALQRGVPDVYKLILKLSKMMRYSMNTSDDSSLFPRKSLMPDPIWSCSGIDSTTSSPTRSAVIRTCSRLSFPV